MTKSLWKPLLWLFLFTVLRLPCSTALLPQTGKTPLLQPIAKGGFSSKAQTSGSGYNANDARGRSSLAMHGGGEEEIVHHMITLPGPIDTLFHEPSFWSTTVMLTIVGLLLAWEEAVETARKGLPKELLSVVDSMLAEMGGLGFIGLFLSVVVTGGLLGELVEEFSEQFLGNGEILLETFEFLHTAFFEVGIGFFIVSGITVGAVLKEVKQLSELSELALDTDGDGEVSLDELADALGVQALVVDADGDGEITEDEITDALRQSKKGSLGAQLSMTSEEIGAEALVIREELINKFKLPESFQVERYFEQIFAHNLEEIVELNPITWLPLVPFIAVQNSVDISNDLVSAASDNAFASCGEFISSPLVVCSSVALQIVGVAWGLFNFWKLFSIKDMLIPTLVRDGSETGEAVLLPPRYEDETLFKSFDSSPSWVRPIETFFAGSGAVSDTNTPHESLFGAAGKNGPELYLNSIKFHSWLCVAEIVFYGTQVVARDATALYRAADNMGNPEMVAPELALYTLFVVSGIAQLTLAPKTFLLYSYATSIEGMTKDWAMKNAIEDFEVDELISEMEELDLDELSAIERRREAEAAAEVAVESAAGVAAAAAAEMAVFTEGSSSKPNGDGMSKTLSKPPQDKISKRHRLFRKIKSFL